MVCWRAPSALILSRCTFPRWEALRRFEDEDPAPISAQHLFRANKRNCNRRRKKTQFGRIHIQNYYHGCKTLKSKKRYGSNQIEIKVTSTRSSMGGVHGYGAACTLMPAVSCRSSLFMFSSRSPFLPSSQLARILRCFSKLNALHKTERQDMREATYPGASREVIDLAPPFIFISNSAEATVFFFTSSAVVHPCSPPFSPFFSLPL